MTDNHFPAHSNYPSGYHVVNFLGNALIEAGATVQYDDSRLMGQEGLTVNGVPMVWFLDNRIPYNRQRQDPVAAALLLQGDVLVCHCQKADMERVGGRWLPIAATPRFTPASQPVEKQYDIGFVGFLNDDHRLGVYTRLKAKFSLFTASGVFYEDAAAVYHAGRVGVNVPALYGTEYATDINMRCTEVMACGVPLVTKYNPALHELGIKSGVNCLTYDNERELQGCIQTLLDDVQLCRDLAANAYALIQHQHTYAHRALTVLEWVDEWLN